MRKVPRKWLASRAPGDHGEDDSPEAAEEYNIWEWCLSPLRGFANGFIATHGFAVGCNLAPVRGSTSHTSNVGWLAHRLAGAWPHCFVFVRKLEISAMVENGN